MTDKELEGIIRDFFKAHGQKHTVNDADSVNGSGGENVFNFYISGSAGTQINIFVGDETIKSG